MHPKPEVVLRFQELSWPNLPTNEEVLQTLDARLWKAAASRRGDAVIYSEWVRDLEFTVPQFFGGNPFFMSVDDWKPEYSHIIGDILGWLNARSYEAHGVLVSAMAINKDTNRPGKRFFGLSKDVGLFKGKSEDQQLTFWVEQMELVKQFAKDNRSLEGPDYDSFVRFVRDGELTVKDVSVRNRCAELAAAARNAHRRPNGALACIVCGWAKPDGPIAGEIVQMHHVDPLSNAPPEGRVVALSDAKLLFMPFCPTCHSMAHAKLGGGVFTLEELKDFCRLETAGQAALPGP